MPKNLCLEKKEPKSDLLHDPGGVIFAMWNHYIEVKKNSPLNCWNFDPAPRAHKMHAFAQCAFLELVDVAAAVHRV